MAQNVKDTSESLIRPRATPRDYTIIYHMVFFFVCWHLGAFYGLYLVFTSAKRATITFMFPTSFLTGIGITAGAHRLWAHRAYKARLPLQIFLMLCQTMACQKTVLNWARDHRLHHKYCDTDADPHNSTRGLFYSHMGWLMVKKHPEVIKMGKVLDMSDLLENPVLRFQKKHYTFLVTAIFAIRVLMPVVFWQESLTKSFYVCIFALLTVSHITFAVNSIAHEYGYKPYDKNISPASSATLSLLAFGEGYHNYHHVFPFDYRVSELGNRCLNFSTVFIDFCALIGWAYDLKQASSEMIAKKARGSGDGTDHWGRLKNEDLSDANKLKLKNKRVNEENGSRINRLSNTGELRSR